MTLLTAKMPSPMLKVLHMSLPITRPAFGVVLNRKTTIMTVAPSFAELRIHTATTSMRFRLSVAIVDDRNGTKQCALVL